MFVFNVQKKAVNCPKYQWKRLTCPFDICNSDRHIYMYIFLFQTYAANMLNYWDIFVEPLLIKSVLPFHARHYTNIYILFNELIYIGPEVTQRFMYFFIVSNLMLGCVWCIFYFVPLLSILRITVPAHIQGVQYYGQWFRSSTPFSFSVFIYFLLFFLLVSL